MKLKVVLTAILLLATVATRATGEVEAIAAAAIATDAVASSKVIEDLKAIPGSAVAVLYFPLGVVQTLVSPITGNYRSGPRNMRVGLLAPARFLLHTFSLPVHALYD